MVKLDAIHFRDPFVLPDPESQVYYLYGTSGEFAWEGKAKGFEAYRSRDLMNWEGPSNVFQPPEDFWADRNFWAPEVHVYNGGYYMFASFKAEGTRRGTQVLRSDDPLGPFYPHSPGPLTPSEWECLDGTLYVQDGTPWLVFCHEWVQARDGEMNAIRLTKDLRATIGEPILLFRASEASWTRPVRGDGMVTDGPFIYEARNGTLVILWSSMGEEGYTQGIARSESGQITGPWEQDAKPLFSKDGGHGMIFETFDGELILTLHCPNSHPSERPILIPIMERDAGVLEMV